VSIDRFAWLARMQAMPLLSAHILDGYVDGEGLLEARFCGSLPLVRAAGQEISRGELMRYLAELIWAPHAMQRNPQLSWREIDASAVEVSAASPGGPARVGLFSRMAISFASKRTPARVRQDVAFSRRGGKDPAATTARWKASAYRPGRR
jgi:Family of unknown function (DUF6544)